mmetsp:Transcript_6757/g.20484  ORF Transcript_6757/g.20484 Transcript_6757/m.20484 type:complete len:263 (+) Transcript_6757:180-968(+)
MFISFRLGSDLQLSSSTRLGSPRGLSSLESSSSLGSSSSLNEIESSCTRSENLTVSQATKMGMFCDFASSATAPVPTLFSTVPLDITEWAPSSTLVAPVMRKLAPLMRPYSTAMPWSLRNFATFRPSYRGRESITATVKLLPASLACLRRASTTPDEEYSTILSPSLMRSLPSSAILRTGISSFFSLKTSIASRIKLLPCASLTFSGSTAIRSFRYRTKLPIDTDKGRHSTTYCMHRLSALSSSRRMSPDESSPTSEKSLTT